MKIILKLFMCCLLVACTTHKKQSILALHSTTISLIIDVTDPRSYLPPSDAILSLYHCKRTPDAECIFRLSSITDKRLSPIQTIQLKDVSNMEAENTDDDPQYRDKSVIAFYGSLKKTLSEFYSQIDTSRTLDNSECFRKIASELNYLAVSKSKERVLLVASDLLEKSDLFNSYQSDISNAVNVAKEFGGTRLLPDTLSGITVIFLFNPRNRTEDEAFYKMSEAYRLLLQQKGALVSIQANL